jgi:hypothetical protein
VLAWIGNITRPRSLLLNRCSKWRFESAPVTFRCSLFDAHFPMLTFRCSLSDAHFSMLTFRCSLFTYSAPLAFPHRSNLFLTALRCQTAELRQPAREFRSEVDGSLSIKSGRQRFDLLSTGSAHLPSTHFRDSIVAGIVPHA